jgi:hypothetical protein
MKKAQVEPALLWFLDLVLKDVVHVLVPVVLDALGIQQLAIYLEVQAVGLVMGDEVVEHSIQELTIGEMEIGGYAVRVGFDKPTLFSG